MYELLHTQRSFSQLDFSQSPHFPKYVSPLPKSYRHSTAFSCLLIVFSSFERKLKEKKSVLESWLLVDPEHSFPQNVEEMEDGKRDLTFTWHQRRSANPIWDKYKYQLYGFPRIYNGLLSQRYSRDVFTLATEGVFVMDSTGLTFWRRFFFFKF